MVHCVWSGGQSLQLRYTDDVSLSAVGVPQAADEIQLLLPQYMLLHTHIYIYIECSLDMREVLKPNSHGAHIAVG